jgi:hypothetical protein
MYERGVALKEEWADFQVLSRSGVIHKTYNGQGGLMEAKLSNSFSATC